MDAIFLQMLKEAEKIRKNIDQRNRFIGNHALQIKVIRKYAEKHNLFQGNLQKNTANNALLNYQAEIAACRLEVSSSKKIGSIFSLVKKEKLELIHQASEIS